VRRACDEVRACYVYGLPRQGTLVTGPRNVRLGDVVHAAHVFTSLTSRRAWLRCEVGHPGTSMRFLNEPDREVTDEVSCMACIAESLL